MAIHILPQAQTVRDAAPWLLNPGVTVHCYRCERDYRAQPDDEIEGDGSRLCGPCATADRIWHREVNADTFYGSGVFDRG